MIVGLATYALWSMHSEKEQIDDAITIKSRLHLMT